MTTTWKDGGPYGRYCRGVHKEEGSSVICYVWTKENGPKNSVVDWPEGEANFRLILKAPKMQEALEAIVALKPPRWPSQSDVLRAYHQCKEIARAAIAAAKEAPAKDEN